MNWRSCNSLPREVGVADLLTSIGVQAKGPFCKKVSEEFSPWKGYLLILNTSIP
jgi:hypothetical protein